MQSVLCVASVGLGGLWGRTLGFAGEEQVERHRRARFPQLMVGCTWPRSPTMPRGSAALPHIAVCAVWQGNPGERGAGEKAAFSPGSLWPPKVLPTGVHLRGGRAGPLPGPGAVTKGDDGEVQSDAESQRPGLGPQATPREAPGCPRRDFDRLFAMRVPFTHLCGRTREGRGSICRRTARRRSSLHQVNKMLPDLQRRGAYLSDRYRKACVGMEVV